MRSVARGEAGKETAARPHQAGRSSAGALRRTGIVPWAPPCSLGVPRGQRLLRFCCAWGDRRIRWSRAEVVGGAARRVLDQDFGVCPQKSELVPTLEEPSKNAG